MYNVGLTYPRYLEEYDSVNKYGIIEEIYSEEYILQLQLSEIWVDL